ncbi:MAG: folate family ECF transporter S component [Clostridiales Family XIII bacterium]|jgi:ECF transporter S component (folate family)|nr:folate family ECF transporter S component [Clostridiales Family XIII bacterium]
MFKLSANAIPVIALFIALNVILTHPLSLNTETLRIGIGYLPIAIAAIAYGPVWATVTAVVGDIIGALLFPSGPFFPGFTASALLTGLIFGLMLHGKNVSWKRMLPAAIIVGLVVNLALDTYWLYFMYGNSVMGMLPMRAVKAGIMIAIMATLTPLVWGRVGKLLVRERR